jgi:hypothetical protein
LKVHGRCLFASRFALQDFEKETERIYMRKIFLEKERQHMGPLCVFRGPDQYCGLEKTTEHVKKVRNF